MTYTCTKTQTYLLFVVIFAIVAFCFGLDARHFWGTTEGRTGQIVKEMIKTGDWVIPHLNYEPRLTKPPLYFWSAAVTSVVFNDGNVTEWTARLPAAVSAMLVVIMTFCMGRRLYNDKIGLFSALMLGTSYSFFWQGRQAALDMMLVMFVTATVMFFVYGLTAPAHRKKYFYWLMHLSCALAVMTKGPVGIFVPWLGILTYLIWTKQLKELKHMQWIAALILFVLIIAPWLIAVKSRITSSFMVFYHETVTRYTSAFDHRRPFYYFIIRYPLYILPWGIGVPFALWDMIKNKTVQPYRFAVSFIFPAFIFFSLCGSKRSYYLIPLYPYTMFMIAVFIRRSSAVRGFIESRLRKYNVKWIIAGMLTVVIAAYATYFALMPILNARNSAVDLVEKMEAVVSENDRLMTYRYSRPYIVFYLNSGHLPALQSEDEIRQMLEQSTPKSKNYILLQEEDFKRMPAFHEAKIVLRYPDFTKKDNHMVLITAAIDGGNREIR